MERSPNDDGLELPSGLISPTLTPVPEESPRDHESIRPLAERQSFVKIGPDSGSRSTGSRIPLGHVRNRSNSYPARGPSPHLPTIRVFADRHDALQSGVAKLSAARISELASASGSLPLRAIFPVLEESSGDQKETIIELQPSPEGLDVCKITTSEIGETHTEIGHERTHQSLGKDSVKTDAATPGNILLGGNNGQTTTNRISRPPAGSRSISVPFTSASKTSMPDRVKPRRLHSKSNTGEYEEKKAGSNVAAPTLSRNHSKSHSRKNSYDHVPQAKAQPVPLPPLSIPTQLHLELSSERPPPLYADDTDASHAPYESSKVKFERLLNFLLLPPQLEQVLLFGALTCLDAWLYTFTILPLRFIKALWLLFRWFIGNIIYEVTELALFIYRGVGRVWNRHRQKDDSPAAASDFPPALSHVQKPVPDSDGNKTIVSEPAASKPSLNKRIRAGLARNRPRIRTKPSSLQAHHKADILEGLLIIFSCIFLMRFDASRMYHSIRGQAAIKLYVIYNALEVFDRLFSALGQDIMECLFSAETLDRKPNGRSRVGRPFWMFLLALLYTWIHSAAFFSAHPFKPATTAISLPGPQQRVTFRQ